MVCGFDGNDDVVKEIWWNGPPKRGSMGSVLAQCAQLAREQCDPNWKVGICRAEQYVLKSGIDKGRKKKMKVVG